MWQTKYTLAVPENWGVGVDFRPLSEGVFLSGRPSSVIWATFWPESVESTSSCIFESWLDMTIAIVVIIPTTNSIIPPMINACFQKYSRLRCLLRVKGLVICFYLGWSGSTLQFRQNITKVGSKSWLLTCSSNITLSLPSYTVSAL